MFEMVRDTLLDLLKEQLIDFVFKLIELDELVQSLAEFCVKLTEFG